MTELILLMLPNNICTNFAQSEKSKVIKLNFTKRLADANINSQAGVIQR